MSRLGCASTVMYPPTQCEDQNIIHTEKGTKQEVPKVGETWMFGTDKGCELLIHSGEASYALRDRK